MKDIMLIDQPIEEREQILRDSCDEIVEKSYTRKFVQNEVDERRAELASVSIQIQELDEELSQYKAAIKGKIKPLMDRRQHILGELKSGGQYVTTEVFKFVDVDEGVAAYYAADGNKIEERPLTQEERQRNIFQVLRNTGTNNE